jgi:TRAP-type C4-dicarboxylate transport system permease small subunit
MTNAVLKRFDQFVALLAMAVLVALLLVVTSGIVSRALGRPFVWTDELASYLMVWVSMLGWMVATRRGVHIRVRVLFDRLPGSGQRVVEACFLLLIALLGSIVALQGYHLYRTNSDVRAITMPFSIGWLYLPLIPAGLTMLLQAGVDFLRLLRTGDTPELNDRSAPL